MKDKLLGIYGLGILLFMWISMTGTPNYPPVGFFEALMKSILWPLAIILALIN